MEYNLYFPPPIKMMLDMSVQEYNHQLRSKVYECSLQYQTEDVMQPLGYKLVQVPSTPNPPSPNPRPSSTTLDPPSSTLDPTPQHSKPSTLNLKH